MALNKEDLEYLEDLQAKSNQFVQDIFDWVAPLGQTQILGNLYDFRQSIENKITELKEAT